MTNPILTNLLNMDQWEVHPQDDHLGRFGAFEIAAYAAAETTSADCALAHLISLLPTLLKLLPRWLEITPNPLISPAPLTTATKATLTELGIPLPERSTPNEN